MGKVGKVMSMGVSLPILAAGAAAFKMASDFNESQNKVDVAFGYMANDVEEWSKTTLKSFGIAQGTALDMAATFGDMGTSMGLSKTAAAEMSKEMVGLAGDMASFKNMNMAEVNTALTAVYTGETESLKRMGIVMTQVNLEQFAMSQGIKTSIKDMTQAELVQLRYNYVLKNTANAQGDFERTGGGAANQMRILTEAVKEVGAKLGQALVPILTPIIAQFNKWIQAFGELNPSAQKTVLIIAGLTAAIGPALLIVSGMIKAVTTIQTAMAAWKAATVAATAAQTGLNVAMLANPIGLIIAGFAALVIVLASVSYALNKNARAAKEATDRLIEMNTQQAAAEQDNIDKSFGKLQAAIDDKIAAENTYTAEVMALNQKAYDDEMAKGQKSLDGMKKNLSERQKALDDNYNKSIELINAEYGVYQETHKSKLDLINEEQEKAVQAQKGIYTAAEETYNKAIEKLREEYGVYQETKKSMVDVAKETADDQITALNKYYDEAKTQADENKELIKQMYDDEVKSAKTAYDEKSALLDAEYDKKLKIIDLGLSEEVKALRDQINAIDGVTKAEDKALQAQRDAEKIAKLESKIANETDVAERMSLQQELQDTLAEIARKQILETREIEKTALEDQIKAAQTRAEEEKAALKETKIEEKKQLDTALETELANLETAKLAKIAAEDEKLAKLKTRIEEETIKINTALEGELIAINAAREEKEAAELLKLEAVKSATDEEIIKINEVAKTAKEKNEEIRAAKEAAETAKYEAAKKSLDGEATYLDTWIDTTYKTALDDKLKLANEKEAERHKLIMDNLAAESAAVQTNLKSATEANNKSFKIKELQIAIAGKTEERNATGQVFTWDIFKRAQLQNEINALNKELEAMQRPSNIKGGVSGINSYAVGTNYVPYDQLAYIHKGEKITPAAQNNTTTNNNQPIINIYQPVRSPYEVAREVKKSMQQTVYQN